MGGVMSDLRYALRGLFARPLFLCVAVLSLGLGIGVNAALFSLYHQVVLRPLPVAEPGRLVNLASPGIKSGNTSSNLAGTRDEIFSYPMFRDLQRLQTSFEGIAAHRSIEASIALRGATRSGSAMLVSGSYFPVLGLAPALGRLIGPQDDAGIGSSPVAVLSHAYWRDQLGADPAIIGRSIGINGRAHVVIGVAPAGFSGTTFASRPEVFVPVTQRWELQPQAERSEENRQDYWLYLFGRLAPGVTLAAARTELDGHYGHLVRELEVSLHASLEPARLEQFAARHIELSPGARGQSTAMRNARLPLLTMLAASALVLLVACLNIANLMLARGAARAGEFAVRASIGASRARLARQMLVESTVIGALGALAGLPLAAATLVLVGSTIPVARAGAFELGLDPVTVQFALGLGLATVFAFGLFPALQLARVEPNAVLRGQSAGSAGSRFAARFRAALAVGQIALSMVALALAGLFLRSLANLDRVDLGLQVERVATFSIAPRLTGYTPDHAAQLFDRIESELATLPGVRRVASSMVPVLSNNEWGSNISLPGFESASPDDMHVYYNKVGEAYFDVFGMERLAGRAFEAADTAGRPKVAVVNRAFVERYGLGGSAIGTRFAFGDRRELDIEIVGVVETTKYAGLREAGLAQVYVPRRQDRELGAASFYVEAGGEPGVLLEPIRARIAALDPDLPVSNLRTMSDQLRELTTTERFVGSLSTGFALLATLLAALGLYGVLSFTLAQRMREIGLRLALGAAPARLRRMLLGQVGRMAVLGVAIGLVVALAVGRAAEALLFELSGHDPGVLFGATLVLVAVALATGWLPARRAGRIDPVEALRHE